jgi:DNA-binding NarL/FixJ family response regulator
MKISTKEKPTIRVALIESDPLRLVGFRALLETESDIAMTSLSVAEMAAAEANLDVALVGDRAGYNLFDTITGLKRVRPNLPMIVIGPRTDHQIMLNALVYGAKGYVFDGAPPGEFASAIRLVSQSLVWAPRRVLSMFVEEAVRQGNGIACRKNGAITEREREVLRMLVAGYSNKEIGKPLGIVERTVKAHIAKMMRKVGVQNRIELSVHALTHSLVSFPVQ